MKKHLLLLLLLSSVETIAQTNDFGVWVGASLKKSFAKHYAVGIETELRLKENVSAIDNILTDVELSRKFGKYVKLSGFYRFSQKNRIDDFEGVNRTGADLSGKIPLVKKLKLAYRSRYQWQWLKGQTEPYTTFWRNRLGLEYKLTKKITPYASYELWYRTTQEKTKRFDRNRLMAGIEYDINKVHSVEVYGFFQREMNRNTNDGQGIVGVSYKIGL